MQNRDAFYLIIVPFRDSTLFVLINHEQTRTFSQSFVISEMMNSINLKSQYLHNGNEQI